MANNRISKEGVHSRFSSTNQPENRGRKPKLYTLAKRGYNVGYDEFREVVLYLMQLTKKQLETVTKDEDTPIWVVNIARAIYKDTGKGVTATLRDLMDRLWGKAPQVSAETISKASDNTAELRPRSEYLSYSPDITVLPPLPDDTEKRDDNE